MPQQIRHNIFKILALFRDRPGLILLLILVSIISFKTIKPEFYLIGWDNFSSYFNQPQNFIRTLFSTWREYRGVGVPSDSEVVDIFRQLFFIVLGGVLPFIVLDQIYYLICFISGILFTYYFITLLLSHLFGKFNTNLFDTASAIGAVFYAFNMNTLGIFYFPIVTYITRFAAIPILLTIAWIFLNSKPSLKRNVFIVFLVVATSGSYLTATVFLTMVFMLGLFLLFGAKLSKILGFTVLYLSLNAFWILPFLNYTIEKSSIIKLAPTFINANETQLNKSAEFYAWKRQSVLYPNFFDSTYKNSSGKKVSFHPLSLTWNKLPDAFSIYSFPLLAVVGSFLIIAKKRNRSIFWVPVLWSVCLFLSMKNYSPLGKLYGLIETNIPYFSVIFRFGDTKFHPYMAIAGSISASYLLYLLLRVVEKKFRKLQILHIGILLICVLFIISPFRSYFDGNLIGEFMYNRLPQAYVEVASIINRDPADFRVLHLPYDSEGYWRSYGWGALGSSFLHYLINNPLFEKNFEPGSTENADINKKISELLQESQRISAPQDRLIRAKKLIELLKRTGTGYIILDQSISAQVPARSVFYWGQFSFYDSFLLMGELIKTNDVSLIGTYPVTTKTYDTGAKLYLYQVLNSEPKVQAIDQISLIDPLTDRDIDIPLEEHFIDSKSDSGILFPFYQRNGEVNSVEKNISYKIPFSRPGIYKIQDGEGNQHMIDVYIQRSENETIFNFYDVRVPIKSQKSSLQAIGSFSVPNSDLNTEVAIGRRVDEFLADWFILGNWTVGPYRLKVDKTYVPVPLSIGSTQQHLASVIVDNSNFVVGLYEENEVRTLKSEGFKATDNPNCYEDKLADYQYNIRNNNSLIIDSINGSTCAVAVTEDFLNEGFQYAEFSLNLKGFSEDLDDTSDSSKSELLNLDSIRGLPKPNIFDICISPPGIMDCLNKHHVTDPSASSYWQIPIDGDMPAIGLQVLLSLRNLPYQQQTMETHTMQMHLFKNISEKIIDIPSVSDEKYIQITGNELDLKFTPPISPYSYYYRKGIDSFTTTNGICENGYRSLRKIGDSITSVIQNCYNELFVTLPYSSNTFALWLVRYGLVSGKFPAFTVKDKYRTVMDEYFSLYQGYPDSLGFKPLRAPELLSSNSLEFAIRKSGSAITYTFIRPNPELFDFLPKDYIVHQDSENMGIVPIWDYEVIQLPDKWQDLKFIPTTESKSYSLAKSLRYHRILASLWQMDIENDVNPILIKFNEGYDRQWAVYDSLRDVWFGNPISLSVKCDGLANCFELNTANTKTYYIFYTPERLSMIGWGITVLAATIFILSQSLFSRYQKSVRRL